MPDEIRRLVPPWCIVQLDEALRIEDASGRTVAYVYFTVDPQRRSVTKHHSLAEARRIAEAICLLPSLREDIRALLCEPGNDETLG